MGKEQDWLADPQMAAAVDELQTLVSARYPSTTYELAAGDDPEGLYVTATVDVDDPDEVVDVFLDRLLTLQIDDALPLYVVPIRTPERRAAMAQPTMQRTVKTLTARRQRPGTAIAHRTAR
jgi:hypothetical protein